jgi:hypothetical protein
MEARLLRCPRFRRKLSSPPPDVILERPWLTMIKDLIDVRYCSESCGRRLS